MNFNKRIFASEEEYQQVLIQELEDSIREANDPNTKWLSEKEFWAGVEEHLYKLENRNIAKSA